MELRGRRAVITGAGSGIGAALAQALHGEGMALVLVDRDAAAVQAVAAPLGARAEVLDVADPGALAGLAAGLQAEGLAVHLLVNNAGITVLGRFVDHSPADWERVMGVNLFGVVWGCRAFLPLLGAEGGRIVNISSLFGIVGVPGQSAYCASKFAVRGLSEALAEELRGSNIGVTVVHPGGVRTRIVADARLADGAPAAADTRDALAAFFARRARPPAAVAAEIVAAVRADRPRLLVCPETTALDWLRRLAPVAGNRLGVAAMMRLMGVGGALRG